MSPPIIRPEVACDCARLRRQVEDLEDQHAGYMVAIDSILEDAGIPSSVSTYHPDLRRVLPTEERVRAAATELRRLRTEVERLQFGVDALLTCYDLAVGDTSPLGPLPKMIVQGFLSEAVQGLRPIVREEQTDE